MQKITTYLWFDTQAEEAMKFYVDVFNGAPNKKAESKIVDIVRHPEGKQVGPVAGLAGKVLHGQFQLAGQLFMAIDGGSMFKFNESISLYVECADQKEIDYFWDALSAVPDSEACGWLKDKYGLSWQIIPENLGKLLEGSDGAWSEAAMDALLKMKKLDIAELKKAAGK